MKTFLAITCGLVIGAAAGVFGAHRYYVRELYQADVASIRQTAHEAVTVATIELGVLEELEAGEHASTKAMLARHVASLYWTLREVQPMSPETRELIDHIQAVSVKSPSLKEALAALPR